MTIVLLLTNFIKNFAMKRLLLIPKLDSYQATLGDNQTLTTPSSGTIRRRKTSIGAVHRANVSFTVKQDDFDYLMAFWRLTKDKAFGCRLIVCDWLVKSLPIIKRCKNS